MSTLLKLNSNFRLIILILKQSSYFFFLYYFSIMENLNVSLLMHSKCDIRNIIKKRLCIFYFCWIVILNIIWFHDLLTRYGKWLLPWNPKPWYHLAENNIIMHVYISPEPGNPVLRCCTALLSLTQTYFHPAHISTPQGAYNACCL